MLAKRVSPTPTPLKSFPLLLIKSIQRKCGYVVEISSIVVVSIGLCDYTRISTLYKSLQGQV